MVWLKSNAINKDARKVGGELSTADYGDLIFYGQMTEVVKTQFMDLVREIYSFNVPQNLRLFKLKLNFEKCYLVSKTDFQVVAIRYISSTEIVRGK